MSSLQQETHQLHTLDGIRVSFDHYFQLKRERVLVIGHGFFKSKGTATFRRMAHAFAQSQDVICMDFRGHGASSGLFTFSAKEDAELSVVLEWAGRRYRRLHVMGFSLGGAIAINTVSRQRTGVEALIAVSAPAVFEEIEFKFWTPEAIRRGIQGLERGAGCRPGNPFMKKQRPIDHVARLEGIPLLFVHGTHDVIVDVRHSHRLFAAAQEPKRLEVIEGGSHAEALFRDDPNGFVQLVTTWQQAAKGGAHG
jgi:pimeloyl-ACP methyl ester carboxylesterase